MITFTNARIITMDNDASIVSNGYLTVSGDTITGSGEGSYSGGGKIIDVNGDLLMPGIINCHSHMAMSLLRGAAENYELYDWLYLKIFPMEKMLTEEDVYFGTLLSVAECVRGGITTVCDSYFFNDAAAEAANKSGINLVLCGADMDANCIKKKVLEKIEQDYNKFNTDKDTVKYIPGCHSVYTCSSGLIEDVADFAASKKSKTYIHLSETLKEVGDCVNRNNGLTPPQFLHKAGYFSYGGIAAHCVYADKDDLTLLKQSGVSPVHCPSSNLKLGSGVAPVYSMSYLGLNVALGTDGSASSNTQDMFKEMYLCSLLQKGVMNKAGILPSYEVLKMATLNGAEALGLKRRGKLKKGYKADIIRLSLKEPHCRPLSNISADSLIYNFKASDVDMTMCGGKIVYSRGEFFLGEDVGKIYSECEDRAKRLKSYIN